MKVIEVANISKSFGDFRAVNDVSFAIDAGTVFGLLGPNGAGKTTTIRMIMDIIIPDTGSVSLLGDSNSQTSTNSIGYLPEERGMYRKMKVGELLLFMAKLKKMPKSEANKQIDYWLERMELVDWKKKKIEDLSKGMQQKVQFIATIIHKPKLLILDEPFSGLDPINQIVIKDIMIELKKAGTTIIFSTHLMESAEKICEEVFIINKGKNIVKGKLSDVKKRFGEHNIYIDFEGSADFLKKSDQVLSFDNYGNHAEVQLKPEGDSQILLREAVEAARISRFEMKEPSLNDIFIKSVGSTNGEKNHEQ